MLSDRSKGIQRLVLLCQCLLVTIVFWSWFRFWGHIRSDGETLTRYLIYNEFVLLGLVFGYWRSRTGCCVHGRSVEETVRHSVRQLTMTLFFLLLYLAAAPGERISRLFFFSFIPLLYLVLLASNYFLPSFLGRLVFGRGQKQKVLLMGPKQKAARVRHWLDQNQHLGLEVMGLLTDDEARECEGQTTPKPVEQRPRGWQSYSNGPHPVATDWSSPFSLPGGNEHGGERNVAVAARAAVAPPRPANPDREVPEEGGAELPVLGRTEELEQHLSAPGLLQVVMVELPRIRGAMRHYVKLCEAHGVRLLVGADLDQIFGQPLAVFEDEGLFFIGLREEPLEDPVNRFLKRCLDIAVSLPMVLFVLPPLMLVARVFQRLQSPGPLLFPQVREGLQKRPFKMFKLRSMHVGDPADESLPKSREDPRLYPFGRFSRKTSLDELPQFLNVLLGDMSVVGPRPHLASYAEQYHQVHFKAYVRSFVKPGITGLAQLREVRGYTETPEQVMGRINSDIEYLENWSLALDCRLILRTVTQVFSPPRSAI